MLQAHLFYCLDVYATGAWSLLGFFGDLDPAPQQCVPQFRSYLSLYSSVHSHMTILVNLSQGKQADVDQRPHGTYYAGIGIAQLCGLWAG